jgi:hypothetical protein
MKPSASQVEPFAVPISGYNIFHHDERQHQHATLSQ